VVAAHHGKEAASVGELALLNVLHPRAIDADRDLVLAFAGDGAGVTTDAFTVVDQESEIRHLPHRWTGNIWQHKIELNR
jgi:hypothetical protein